MGAARRQRRPRRGALVIIAALLVGSATIRLGIGAGAALARTESGPPPPVGAVQECRSEADMAALLVALQQREEALARRDQQIRLRTQALAAADSELQKKLDAL